MEKRIEEFTIDSIKEQVKWCSQLLMEFDYEKNDLSSLIDFIIAIETDLWRARISLVRIINQ